MTHPNNDHRDNWKSSSVPPISSSSKNRKGPVNASGKKKPNNKIRASTSPVALSSELVKPKLTGSSEELYPNAPIQDSLFAHTAAKEGDIETLCKLLLKKNCDEIVNCRDQFGSTPLHLSSFHGRKECVQKLLSTPCIDINCKDLFGRTPIFYAARNGHREILQMLIQRGGDISVKTDAGETAVHKASYYGRLDCLKVLFKQKEAIASLTNEGDTVHCNTPLHYASMRGNISCVQFLLDHGALINARSSTLSTPLHLAVCYKQLDVVRLLLERNADAHAKDANGRTPLEESKALSFSEISTFISEFYYQTQMEELKKKDFSSWSAKDVGKWISIIGFSQYRDSFEGNDVTGRSLVTLNLTILKNELAISSYGDRTTILEKIRELKELYETRIEIPTFLERRGSQNSHVIEYPHIGEDSAMWRIEYSELQFKELLGKGFYGEVRKAIWNGTDVAVKVIYRESSKSSQSENEVFYKEVNILSKLRHPNVLLFLGACSKDENRCIVTEYMAGGSLYNLIHRTGELLDKNPMLKYRIILDICKGMAYLHDLQIMHRDLTTKNILLDANLNCKVSDFGLSIALDDKGETTTSLGCLPYQSPEVFRGDAYSNPADVYSFGCVVYELISGMEPHKGLQPLKFANMVAYEGYRPNIPPCPDKWEKLIKSCWSADTSSRPSFKAILTDIMSSELQRFDLPKTKNSDTDIRDSRILCGLVQVFVRVHILRQVLGDFDDGLRYGPFRWAALRLVL